MLAGLKEGIPLIDREMQPRLSAVDDAETLQNHEDLRIATLAGEICDQSLEAMRINSTTEARVVDPLQSYRDLKYFLVGDVRPVARLNLHYPPGVERMTRRGRRVYGVECAVKVDAETGDVLIWRKDDIPNSSDPTDWLVVTGNLKTGVFDQREVVMVDIQPGEEGDALKLQVAPVADPRNMGRGFTTITGQFSSGYHAVGEVQASRAMYYGRGVGSEPQRFSEGHFGTDIYELHEALRQALEERGLSDSMLDHAPDPKVALGQYALMN